MKRRQFITLLGGSVGWSLGGARPDAVAVAVTTGPPATGRHRSAAD